MIKSMTGYSRAEALIAGRKIVLEMKSTNHRYLEIALRLPPLLGSLEGEIRRRVGEHFLRGRIEVSFRIDAEGGGEANAAYGLNLALARNYYQLLCRLKEELGLAEEIGIGTLAAFRDIFTPMEAAADSALLAEGVAALLDEAMGMLSLMREREGESLRRDMAERLAFITRLLAEIEARAPQVVQEYQARLAERIRELTAGMAVDEWRLAQEVAIMADKSDVTEEVVRFRSHLDQFSELLEGGEGAGRKIDFLIQEMGREVNTIGSKSGDTKIARLVIEIKSELAKLREQVQNIE